MMMSVTLNNPLTEEDLDKIYDVDMDNTSVVTFHTKHGKEVEFVKVVRCKDCKFNPNDTWFDCPMAHLPYKEDRWCWKGERKDE